MMVQINEHHSSRVLQLSTAITLQHATLDLTFFVRNVIARGLSLCEMSEKKSEFKS